LVLNQCNYIILDEADRMVDMGFEPQIVGVLDNMGGLLKSEDETQAEEQIIQAKEGTSLVRITAMFSATMPPGVERIARTYLRHPVIIKIGDEDTGKNKRIEQRVQFITAAQKKNFLLEDVQKLKSTDKCIIFVNEKKQGDFIGSFIFFIFYEDFCL
jgi:ATP-dependent RNA helicase DDX23/PRP28